MSPGRRRALRILAGVLALGLLAAGAWAWRRAASRIGEPPCSDRLTRSAVDRSIALGTRFLLANQKAEGNFNYEYDWRRRSFAPDDSAPRQAGAAWGLALLHQDRPSAEVGAAARKALAFFEEHSRVSDDGRRWVAYPGDPQGQVGTVALVALALVDTLRADAGLDAESREKYRRQLDEYLAFLLSAREGEGRFVDRYDPRTGRPSRPMSPYSEGEALLALARTARHLGREDLWPAVRAAAAEGHRVNVERALAADPDSKTTKGYYQWASMSWLEIAGSEGPRTKYGRWLVELADWMIDVHRTLDRRRNTAYAYEGIVSAYRMAVLRGDRSHQEKLGCVIELGLEKLVSWQVGGPLQNDFLRRARVTDPLAVGGVQNAQDEPPLRIDVTQHQMHALVLARRYYFH